MKFYAFHLMPWPHLPADFADTNDSAWVWCPVGAVVYGAEAIDQLHRLFAPPS